MFDINNPLVIEPEDTIVFNRYPGTLREHVEKHVLNREVFKNREDERWFQLPGFDPETIAAARRGDKEALQALMRPYVETLRNVLLTCCRWNAGHRHIFAIKDALNPRFIARFPNYDREPELVIECWSENEKLVVVASALVKDGEVLPYCLKTGYRPFPKLSGSAWLKNVQVRDKDESNYFEGKRRTTIAEHIDGKIGKQ